MYNRHVDVVVTILCFLNRYGEGKWSQIAAAVGHGRRPHRCRSHWQKYLKQKQHLELTSGNTTRRCPPPLPERFPSTGHEG
mmetsp:Transcript_25722/g.101437  ORF Transcript_25722/g.101437 Transcript_25722/m.101437 type:complete len:81 (-) Transcript_25722:495-737(-)